MKVIQSTIFVVFFSCACVISVCNADTPNLIPIPKRVDSGAGVVALPSDARVIARDRRLLPLANVLSHNIFMQTGVRLLAALDATAIDGIILTFNSDLSSEEHTLSIDDSITVSGGDYRAVVWGTSTLLQLVSMDGELISFPRVQIADAPDYEFRGVMLDLARRWHPLDTVKQTIDLLSLYKVNYLHLHLSDNQSCVYTSRVLPKMASRQAYSWDEMAGLVQYADQRGVTIIPEIDVPGHGSSWVRKMPDLFGTTDPATGESRPLGIVNMANEKAYESLDRLVSELCEVFHSSPYIHIGTDETGAGGLMKLPEYQPYCQQHGLTEAASGKAHELFLHFIERMNKTVRRHGKQAIAWNDFGGASTSNVSIPTDLTTMYWVGSAEKIAKLGYPIINCCRLPLYIVPPQQSAPEDDRIYDWSVHTVANWHSSEPSTLPKSPLLLGAQICFWEQRYNEVIPILRPRVPAFAERTWHENANRTIEDLRQRRLHTDRVVQNVIAPVTFAVEGLANPQGVGFDKSLTVTARSKAPGTIRYSLSNQWESFPGPASPVMSDPILLDDTSTVSAQLFDEQRNALGGVTQQRFRKMTPAYRYRLLGPTPNQAWTSMPDFASLDEIQSGVMGLMDQDRGDQINRSMFAGLNPDGHIDVRLHGVYNPFTLELTGQIRFSVDGTYVFKLRSRNGLSEVHSGASTIIASNVPGREHIVEGKIKAGTYPLLIKHFYRITRNELNVWVKQPGAQEFAPLESLVVPMSDWFDEEMLSRLPGDAQFMDPVRQANFNLATDKPVTATSWQGNFVPANVVDGITDNTSGWHADPYPQSLQVDLEKTKAVSRIRLYPYHDGRRSYQYEIAVSVDGKTWKQVVDMTKNVKPATSSGDEHNFDPVRCRFVKVTMTNNTANPGVHVNELMVFEPK